MFHQQYVFMAFVFHYYAPELAARYDQLTHIYMGPAVTS